MVVIIEMSDIKSIFNPLFRRKASKKRANKSRIAKIWNDELIQIREAHFEYMESASKRYVDLEKSRMELVYRPF